MRQRTRQLTAAITAATPLLLFAPVALAQQGYYWHGGWAGMIIGPIMMILFLAILVGLVVLGVRWMGGSNSGSPFSGRQRSLDILEERFARGEIDKAEFDERRRALRD